MDPRDESEDDGFYLRGGSLRVNSIPDAISSSGSVYSSFKIFNLSWSLAVYLEKIEPVWTGRYDRIQAI